VRAFERALEVLDAFALADALGGIELSEVFKSLVAAELTFKDHTTAFVT